METANLGRVDPGLSALIDADLLSRRDPSICRARRRLVSNSAKTPSMSKNALPAAMEVSTVCSVALERHAPRGCASKFDVGRCQIGKEAPREIRPRPKRGGGTPEVPVLPRSGDRLSSPGMAVAQGETMTRMCRDWTRNRSAIEPPRGAGQKFQSQAGLTGGSMQLVRPLHLFKFMEMTSSDVEAETVCSRERHDVPCLLRVSWMDAAVGHRPTMPFTK